MEDYYYIYKAENRSKAHGSNCDKLSFVDRFSFEKLHHKFCKAVLGIKKTSCNISAKSLGSIPNLSLSLLVLSCKTRERQESFSLVQFLTGTVCHGLESPIETSNDAVFFYQLMKTVFTFFQLSCVTSDIIFNFCRVSIGRFRIMCYFCIIYHCLKDIFLSCYI
jgi:hypothetical protein